MERHFGIESVHFDSNHFNEVNKFIEDNYQYFYPPEDPDDYRFDVGNEHELVAIVDAQTLTKFVKFLKRGKAPGPDIIHNEVLRLGTTTSLFHHLARLFTSSIQLGYIPTAFSLNVRNAANLLQQDLLKVAVWCAKWRIKLNPEKTKVIIFSRSMLARKAELNLKLYGETLKIYPQVKFLGVIFYSKLTFQPHFDILERGNNRYYRLRLLANKKWGPSPATLIQIYTQCVRPIFEYGSLSTITVSDHIISKIHRLQNKFIRLALRLQKYILPKLLHDSTGLPYMKDHLLSCATQSLDRITQDPLVEASISSNWFNPAWDRFPMPLSVIRPGSS